MGTVTLLKRLIKLLIFVLLVNNIKKQINNNTLVG